MTTRGPCLPPNTLPVHERDRIGHCVAAAGCKGMVRLRVYMYAVVAQAAVCAVYIHWSVGMYRLCFLQL